MNFNRHLELNGRHSFLSPSKYHWLNYDDDKLTDVYLNQLSVQRGIQLHDFAKSCIDLNQRLPKSNKTLNKYVNDAIGYRMTPEQPLIYSSNCFGTTDAISFRNNLLRIHDLKTGSTPAHMEQLEIYAALFCYEYGIDPSNIDIELRIYQNNDILYANPDPDRVNYILDKIKRFDDIINKINESEE